MAGKTTLWVTDDTKRRLRSFGQRGETDDQVLNWLMDEADKKK